MLKYRLFSYDALVRFKLPPETNCQTERVEFQLGKIAHLHLKSGWHDKIYLLTAPQFLTADDRVSLSKLHSASIVSNAFNLKARA